MEKIFDFDPAKNLQLIDLRGISFEEIIAVLGNAGPLDVLMHKNTKRYANQKVYVVELYDYVYLVPFVEEDNKIFLKTAFPSRKATKQYLRNRGEPNL